MGAVFDFWPTGNAVMAACRLRPVLESGARVRLRPQPFDGFVAVRNGPQFLVIDGHGSPLGTFSNPLDVVEAWLAMGEARGAL